MNRIGILGGTFDPPHIGHLIIAQEVASQLKLEQVWFIPTYEPPHKNVATENVVNRIKMLDLALANNDLFKISTIEVERSGKSYTIDTLISLKEKNPSTEFYLIIGADMVEYLPKWYKIDELIKLVQFVGVRRTGYELNSPYPIQLVDIPLIDISSTMIRERLQKNEPIRYLVPDSIYTYIKEHGLYE